MTNDKPVTAKTHSDFYEIKDKISEVINGHRNDVVVAALRSLTDDALHMVAEDKARILQKDLMREIEESAEKPKSLFKRIFS